jgi:hypothetical protein
VIGTYTPSLPEYSRSLMDIKVTADGLSAWVVDLWSAQLFKFDIATMTEIATYPTYMIPGTVLQMALYAPAGPVVESAFPCIHGSSTAQIDLSGSSRADTPIGSAASITGVGSYGLTYPLSQGSYDTEA